MKVYKAKAFHQWAEDEGIHDDALREAVKDMENGLLGDSLGGNVYKKRMARVGGGKSGGFRTILAFREEGKAFFIYGFAKNKRANVTDNELKALKKYAKILFDYCDDEIKQAVQNDVLFEVLNDE